MSTSLSIKSLPIVECWNCHNCGNCCRGSIVRLDEADVRRLRNQRWEDHPDYQGTAIYVRESRLCGGRRMVQREDGSCMFLTEEGFC